MEGNRRVAALAALVASCCVQGFLVDVTPRRPLLLLGERRSLICSARDCPSPPHVVWTSPGDRPLDATVTAEGAGATITFNPVTTDHEGPLQCQVVCSKETKHVTVRVRVYAFPSPPVVSGQDDLRWGSEAVLTCHVPGFYPEDRLLLTWIKEDRVLQTGPPESPESPEPAFAEPVSRYRFTPSQEDLGANVTCRAGLDQQDQQDYLYRFNWTREATITIHPLSPPTGSSLKLFPGSDALEGDQMTFSCQSHGAPPPTLVLKREGVELHKTIPDPSSSTSSLTFIISSVVLEDSAHYSCHAANQLGSQIVSQSLAVRAHPFQVEASRQLAADRGSAVSLVCRASGCPYPPDVAWTQTNRNRDSREMDGSGLVSQDQDSQDQQSGDQDRQTVLRLQELDLNQQGVYTCRARCGTVIREKLVEVYIYSFPLDPVLSGPVPSPVLIGRETELRCDVIDVFSPNQARVRWLWGDRVLVSKSFRFSESLQNLSLTLTYQADQVDLDQNLVLTCSAELLDQNGDVWRIRETRINLDLHSPPNGTSLQLLPGSDVLEGDHVTLRCYSHGVPSPTLVLRREGVELHQTGPATSPSSSSLSIIISSANLHDSAHYTCQAANQHGSQMETVSLRVRAPPRNMTVTIWPSNVIPSGLNVTVRCHSVSSPPPAITLTRLADGTTRHSDDGEFLLVTVDDGDSGLYRINASNWLGYQVQVFRLKVTGPGSGPGHGPIIFVVPAVCSLAVLLAAVLIVEYLRRSRKKGFYQLAPQASSAS